MTPAVSPARRLLSWAATACAWTLIGAGVGLVFAVLAPLAIGAKPYTVLTGSMEPGIHPGDLVIAESVSPAEAELGEVVVFNDPSRDGELVTHRLVRAVIDGDEARMVTKGDANDTVERWAVPTDGQIGRVVYRVPQVGSLLALVRSGPGPVILITIPVVAIALMQLLAIWRPREATTDEPVAEAASVGQG